MRDFFRMLRLYGWPYKKCIFGSVLMNVLSAVLNIFSFTLIIPILQILFNINEMQYEFIPWNTPGADLKETAVNNLYYFVTRGMELWGASRVLLLLCLFLIVMTFLKTAS